MPGKEETFETYVAGGIASLGSRRLGPENCKKKMNEEPLKWETSNKA